MTDTAWTIRNGRVIPVIVVSKSRSWYHLKSGGEEWKQQSPTLAESRQDAFRIAMYQVALASTVQAWSCGKNDEFWPIDLHKRMVRDICKHLSDLRVSSPKEQDDLIRKLAHD